MQEAIKNRPNYKIRRTALLWVVLVLFLGSGAAFGASSTKKTEQQKGTIALIQAQIQRGRETGDAQYFDRAQRILGLMPQNGKEAAKILGLQAWIALFQHRFHGAVVLANAAQALEPKVAFYFGLISDAHLELGIYDKAISAAQRMLDLRPDQAAFSRAAHLRSLHGDPEGAIPLWKRAIQSGGGKPENTAWCQVELGDEYFNLGQLEAAAQSYRSALESHPGYHRAFAALGRLASAQNQNKEALAFYHKSLAVLPKLEYAAALSEVYLALGNRIEAEKHFALVDQIAKLDRLNSGQNDRALAIYYADHDRNLIEAIRIAKAEVVLRKDIHSEDILGWVYYKSGRYEEAATAMHAALRTGARHPLIHFHAGMIAHALGQEKTAAFHLEHALKQNPHFHYRHAATARKTLKYIRSKGGHS